MKGDLVSEREDEEVYVCPTCAENFEQFRIEKLREAGATEEDIADWCSWGESKMQVVRDTYYESLEKLFNDPASCAISFRWRWA